MATMNELADRHPFHEQAAAQASKNTIFLFSVTLACLWFFSDVSPGIWIVPFWLVGAFVVSIAIAAPLFALGCKGVIPHWLYQILEVAVTVAATYWAYLAVFGVAS